MNLNWICCIWFNLTDRNDATLFALPIEEGEGNIKNELKTDITTDTKTALTTDTKATVTSGVKSVELQKAEARSAKLSKVPKDGKDFTRAGHSAVIDENKAKYGGVTVCENCKANTTRGQQSRKGVTPLKIETQVDHVIPKEKNGSGTPLNGQVLCRGCNRKKSNN